MTGRAAKFLEPHGRDYYGRKGGQKTEIASFLGGITGIKIAVASINDVIIRSCLVAGIGNISPFMTASAVNSNFSFGFSAFHIRHFGQPHAGLLAEWLDGFLSLRVDDRFAILQETFPKSGTRAFEGVAAGSVISRIANEAFQSGTFVNDDCKT